MATTLRDLRLLKRNGFIHAAGLMAAALIIVLQFVPESARSWMVPLLLFGNFVANAFYFSAGMMLLEKAERTLPVQFVTPLRTGEYLWSRCLALTLLTLAESLLIVAFAGVGNWLLIALAVSAATPLLCQLGLLMVTRYDSINRFLMPSVPVTFLLALPLLYEFELWPSPLLMAHPVYPCLALLFGGFEPTSIPKVVLALGLATAWALLGAALTGRVLRRYARTP
ncbi:MAG: hypothetical protein QNJ40_17565 [Xanthomonadales bacterium]|nr:hypothetical protein [Xanthomonadales bacterium]